MGIEGMASLSEAHFEGDIARFVETMSSAADTLVSTTVRLTDTAHQPTDRIALSAAARDLGRSIEAIVRQLGSARLGADDGGETPAMAARKTGEIGALIADIAEQANLLALEAMIVEATRSAVAAADHRPISPDGWTSARHTAEASEEIARRIQEIQQRVLQAAAVVAAVTRA